MDGVRSGDFSVAYLTRSYMVPQDKKISGLYCMTVAD